VAVVRGEDRLALDAQGAKMRCDVGGLRDLVQRVGVALAVKVHAVFVADGVELVHVEKLGERLVFVRGGQVRVDDLVSTRPVSGGFHFVFLLCFGFGFTHERPPCWGGWTCTSGGGVPSALRVLGQATRK